MKIRLAEQADGAACADIYRPIVETTAISFETEAPSSAEMARRIGAALPRFPWLVATESDQLLGYVYASAHRERAAYRWSVDVTAYMAETARRRGVGRKLYLTLFDLLRRQGYRSAFAGITLPNAASVGLHEAVGFEHLGVYKDVGYKLGGWHPVGWWRLALNVSQDAPVEPLPLAQLRQDSAFDSWLCS